MFYRTFAFSVYLLSNLAVLAIATPTNVERGVPTTTITVTPPYPVQTTPASQCNTGNLQCCNSVNPAYFGSVSTLLELIGVVVSDPNVLVGVNCYPISVIGVGGDSCWNSPVCCEENHFRGIVAIGCTPVNLNLK